MQYQQDILQQQRNNEQQQYQQNQKVIQVDGKKMFIGGLDYNLLNQQKKKQFQKHSSSELLNINNKLKVYEDRLNLKKEKNLQSIIDLSKNIDKNKWEDDQEISNLIRVIKNKYENVKPKVGVNTSYLFDTRVHFGALLPQVINRRMVRNNQAPTYTKFDQKTIRTFRQLLHAKPSKQNTNQLSLKAKQILGQMQNQDEQQNNSDSDDIFDDKPNKKSQKKVQISIGRKLKFDNVNQEQIFEAYKRPAQKQNQYQDDVIGFSFQQNKDNDKYAFMRKKVKVNPNLNEDDGYGQCYAQNGPSLQQMKQLKKAGIQLFGDAKQFKQKEKKMNWSKQYDKVMRVIQQKKKKSN